MKAKKNRLVPALLLIVMLAFITILLVDLVPILVQVVKDYKNEDQMVSYIDSYEAKGVLLIICLQALQVIVAFIPAAAIQVLSGLCYGVWGGAGLCLVGCVLGNIVVFVALRQFDQVLGPLFARKRQETGDSGGKRKRLNLQRITQMKNPQRAAFVLYLIPCIPNGILPYLFARSKITFWQYLVAVVAASIPSMLLCTWLGERLAKGDWKMALVIVAAVVVLAVLLLLFRNKLLAKISGKPTGGEQDEEAARPGLSGDPH